MACFLVPGGEAIVTTVVQKVVEKKEKGAGATKADKKGKWSQRLGWLNTMLWGGCFLLCLEHIWHGEVVPWPPFLTAMESAGEASEMLHEMATYGITMAVVITVIWGVMVIVAELRARAEELPESKPQAAAGGV